MHSYAQGPGGVATSSIYHHLQQPLGGSALQCSIPYTNDSVRCAWEHFEPVIADALLLISAFTPILFT